MADSQCQEKRDKLNSGGVSSAGHWIRVLQCRQHCVEETATRPGRSFPVPDFLPSQLKRLHEAHAQGLLGRGALGVMAWKQVQGRLVFHGILSPVSSSLPVSGPVVGQGSVGTVTSGRL